MSSRESRLGREQAGGPQEGWLRSFGLFGLAAGGVIGSGWFLTPADAYRSAGSASHVLWSWAVGGLAMLVIAVVMVELGTAAPRTGGMIFLPYQSSGPLVTLVVATSLWIYYVINLTGEAIAATIAIAPEISSRLGTNLLRVDQSTGDRTLNGSGTGVAIVFMMIISAAVVLVPARRFVGATAWITVIKVAGVFLVCMVLLAIFHYHGYAVSKYKLHAPEQGEGDHSGHHGLLGAPIGGADDSSQHGWLATLGGSSTVYAYVGFQGPLDYAGDIKKDGIGEGARIRRAILGTVLLSILVYILLQVTYNRYHGAVCAGDSAQGCSTSPWVNPSDYLDIAGLTTVGYLRSILEWTLRILTMVAPLGAGLVYAYVLPSEIAELSRLGLTYRPLATSAPRKNGWHIYWLVLAANVAFGTVLLVVFHGYWSMLSRFSGVLSLLLYAFPAVALVSLSSALDQKQPLPSASRRRFLRGILPRVSFVVTALMLYETGFSILWRAIAALAVGVVVLVGAPTLRERLKSGRALTNPDGSAAWAAAWLAGYLGGLLPLAWWAGRLTGTDRTFLACVVAVWAWVCCQAMIRHSRAYNAKVRPNLS